MSSNGTVVGEPTVPLLDQSSSTVGSKYQENDHHDEVNLTKKVWIESKKLWHISGPAIFNCIASYSVLVITQSFVGHLSDLEFAGFSIATNVIVSFDYGLLVRLFPIFISQISFYQ